MSEYPYPGLRPFQREETDIFFGRENQTDDLVEKLERTHFLAVLGASGCGKSSLIRTGLLPALDSGFMGSKGAFWAVAVLRPGNQPFANLAEQLLKDEVFARSYPLSLQDGELAQGILEAELRRGPLALHELLASSPLPDDCHLHIVIDQFEELFRYHREGSGDLADAFVCLLLEAHRHEKIFITLTMRSDFLGDCSHYLGLPEAINRGLFLTPRLSRDEMADAISLPARVFDGKIESALVNHLLNEASANQQDQLPLLQHALMRMWKLDEDKHLTLAEYKALGDLRQSLSDHADKAFSELSTEQQKIAEIMFRRLTEAASDLRDTRNPTTVTKIMTLAKVEKTELVEIIDVFRKPSRCFLTPGKEIELNEELLIDISHESLIRQWQRLREWSEDEAEQAEIYQRLASAARRWKNRKGELWGGVDLILALEWKNNPQISPEWANRYNAHKDFDFELTMSFLDESESADQKAREAAEQIRVSKYRRLRLFALGSVSSLIVILFLISNWYYDNKRIHESYYADFTKVYGLPKGIVPLSNEQIKHRAYSLKFIRRGSKNEVDTIDAIDSLGRCITAHPIGTYLDWSYQIKVKSQACRWEFIRDAQDRIIYEKAFDKNGQLVWGIIYSPPTLEKGQNRLTERRGQFVSADGYPKPQKKSKANFVRIEYTSEGYDGTVWYTDRTGVPALGPDKQFAIRYQYNKHGQHSMYTSLDKNGNAMNDIVGNASLKIEYDFQGFAKQYTALDAEQKAVMIHIGYSIRENLFDENGNLSEEKYFDVLHKPTEIKNGYHKIKFEYDERGNITKQFYYDRNDNPTLSVEGYHHSSFEYDANNNLIDVSVYDMKLNLVVGQNGYARFTQKFDSNNNVIKDEIFDTSGKTTLSNEGYAIAEYQYDTNGNIVKKKFIGVNGQPATTKGGYSGWAAKYNGQNLLIQKQYIASNNQLVIINKGYAQYQNSYDKSGNKIEVGYFDLNNERVMSIDGYAGFLQEYDQFGNETRVSYFDIDKKPLASKEGYAAWRKEYDDRGNKIKEAYFDANGASFILKDGYTAVESDYDPAGNEIERRFLNAAGVLTTIKGGYASWQASYDARGKQTEIRYYNLNKTLVINTTLGYAKKASLYNNKGQLLHEAYFDAYSLPIMLNGGFASQNNIYDHRGNNIETSYFDGNDQPVLKVDGYYKAIKEFDIFGHQTKTAYFDIIGHPVAINAGYSIYTRGYDHLGNLTTQQLYNAEGKPTLIYPDNFHKEVRHYNAQGRIASYSHYGINQQPVMHQDGYHKKNIIYDNRGRITREDYLDTNLKLVNPEAGCASWLSRYNDRGYLIETKTLNTENKPCSTKIGYAQIKYTFDLRGQNTGVAIFDTEGRPARHPDGWFSWEQVYDQAGNVIKFAYLGTDGKPIQLKDGFASWTGQYNPYRNLIERRHYGARNEAVINKTKNYHRFENKYNERQELIEVTTFDEQDALIMNNYGYARMQLQYDIYGHLVEHVYYNNNDQPTEIKGCKRYKWLYDESGNYIDEFCEKK